MIQPRIPLRVVHLAVEEPVHVERHALVVISVVELLLSREALDGTAAVGVVGGSTGGMGHLVEHDTTLGVVDLVEGL